MLGFFFWTAFAVCVPIIVLTALSGAKFKEKLSVIVWAGLIIIGACVIDYCEQERTRANKNNLDLPKSEQIEK